MSQNTVVRVIISSTKDGEILENFFVEVVVKLPEQNMIYAAQALRDQIEQRNNVAANIEEMDWLDDARKES